MGVETGMEVVRDALALLVARPEVDGVVLLSPEGLVVASQVDQSVDPDALAALGVTVVRSSQQLSSAAGRGMPERLVLETPGGMILACPLTDGAILLVLAGELAGIGTLLFDLRQLRGNLAALL